MRNPASHNSPPYKDASGNWRCGGCAHELSTEYDCLQCQTCEVTWMCEDCVNFCDVCDEPICRWCTFKAPMVGTMSVDMCTKCAFKYNKKTGGSTQYYKPNPGEPTKWDELAWAQRGEPEEAMHKVAQVYGGGVLNVVVEHIGDLTHRMSERNTFEWGGYPYVLEKVERGLRYLRHRYGFEREMEENITNNAEYQGKDEKTFRKRVYEALREYAAAHSELPVFNEVQTWARDAAIAVGERNWWKAEKLLAKLKAELDKGLKHWVARAHEE